MHIGFISIIARSVGEICSWHCSVRICLLVRLEKVQFVHRTESERFIMFSRVQFELSQSIARAGCFLHLHGGFSRPKIGVGSHEASPNLMQKQQSKWH
jgi:hypothetical protein